MTEAPDRIFLSPKDAELFGRKYGHPNVPQVWVGDDSVEYIRADLQADAQAHYTATIYIHPYPYSTYGGMGMSGAEGLLYWNDLTQDRSDKDASEPSTSPSAAPLPGA